MKGEKEGRALSLSPKITVRLLKRKYLKDEAQGIDFNRTSSAQ